MLSVKSASIGFLFGFTLNLVYTALFTIFNNSSSHGAFNFAHPTDNITKSLIRTERQCLDKDLKTFVTRRGENYTVINNFVKAQRRFHCDESITLTTPADVRFLDNVVPLVERWKGPISVALYATGDDFYLTLNSIAYLRNCEETSGDKVRDFVTFHIIFSQGHFPKSNSLHTLMNAYEDNYKCDLGPPFANLSEPDLYKTKNKLLYPINVVRNVARENAETHFIFASDIELFPTPSFIPKFLQMAKDLELYKQENRTVYVLPLFEILGNETIPNKKSELQIMFKQKRAQWFHAHLCKACHVVIEGEKWLKKGETRNLGIFATDKRQGKYKYWEPFYVGTNDEPFFDERLTWEGQSNKMTQAYSMCLMKYDYAVLDNAFLTHKPGIKKEKDQLKKFGNVVKMTRPVLKTIKLELQSFYGTNKKCGNFI